eukprot:361536-Chlamydomonas_euryale.AAC.1
MPASCLHAWLVHLHITFITFTAPSQHLRSTFAAASQHLLCTEPLFQPARLTMCARRWRSHPRRANGSHTRVAPTAVTPAHTRVAPTAVTPASRQRPSHPRRANGRHTRRPSHPCCAAAHSCIARPFPAGRGFARVCHGHAGEHARVDAGDHGRAARATTTAAAADERS